MSTAQFRFIDKLRPISGTLIGGGVGTTIGAVGGFVNPTSTLYNESLEGEERTLSNKLKSSLNRGVTLGLLGAGLGGSWDGSNSLKSAKQSSEDVADSSQQASSAEARAYERAKSRRGRGYSMPRRPQTKPDFDLSTTKGKWQAMNAELESIGRKNLTPEQKSRRRELLKQIKQLNNESSGGVFSFMGNLADFNFMEEYNNAVDKYNRNNRLGVNIGAGVGGLGLGATAYLRTPRDEDTSSSDRNINAIGRGIGGALLGSWAGSGIAAGLSENQLKRASKKTVRKYTDLTEELNKTFI